MQAGGGVAANAIAYLRDNPVMAIAALAVLFGVGYGAYVYMQIAHPGVFVRQAATKPQENAPPAPAAVPPAPAATPEAPPGAPAIAGAAPATPPGVPSTQAPGSSSSGSIAAPSLPAPATPPAQPAAAPLPAASVIAAAPPAEAPRARAREPRAAVSDAPRVPTSDRDAFAERAPAAAGAPESRRERGSFRPEPEPAPRAASRASAAAARATSAPADSAAPGRERITVSPSNAQPRLNPMLAQAYSLLQNGNIEEARPLYTKVSQSEPLNVDALLGLAYIAAQENRSDEAVKLYLRILQLNPRHAMAQGALIGLMGRADPAASESRLKQLIANEPSAFLHFVLGNLHADQSQWTQAQQSYFQAHHLEPDNADYAYNVAVGLDHLRQPKLALNFYRRAEQLAAAQGRSNFNLSHARERIRVLSSQVE
jgi:Tfp pilus assembly protein PilF